MVIKKTKAVAVSIHAVSPESILGAVVCAAVAVEEIPIKTAEITVDKVFLKSIIIFFSRADTNRFFDIKYKNFSITDLLGRRSGLNRLNCFVR